MSRPTALVTGAAGFIGAHVTRALVAGGRVHVIAFDDLSGGRRDNVPPGVEFIEGSILDQPLVARIFADRRVRYVYHLAAYAAEGLSHFIRRFNYANNVIGSVTLINEAVRHEVECFVFTSSIAVYGAIEPPMREDQTPHPEDPYGIAKLAVEQDLAAARRQFGLRSIVFRPHNVYGEYQNLSDPYRNVVGIFMRQVITGTPMTIFGDGEQRRAFSYIGDVAPVIAESPWVDGAANGVFNVGADESYTVNELAHGVAAAMGAVDHPVVHLPARNEVQWAWSDHSRARAIFGDRASTPLAAGLARMAEWARGAGLEEPTPFAAIEVTRGLPPSWARLRNGER